MGKQASAVSFEPSVESVQRPSQGFNWLMTALGVWLVTGAHMDAWAHTHIPQLESFFTPYHGILYAGWLANATVLSVITLRRRRTMSFREAVPFGYGLALIGSGGFLVSGFLDMLWHTFFGIEEDFAALISPTHLLLMLSAALIVSGPLRANWLATQDELSWSGVLSATLLLSIFTFFAQFDHPYTNQLAFGSSQYTSNTDGTEELGVLGVLINAAFLMGIVLPLVKRFRLPFFALTIMLGLNAFSVVMIRQYSSIMWVAVVAGLVGDFLARALLPSADRTLQTRVFAFLLPVVLYGMYFAVIDVSVGIWWPVHVWVGATVLSGVLGVLISWLVSPKVLDARFVS